MHRPQAIRVEVPRLVLSPWIRASTKWPEAASTTHRFKEFRCWCTIRRPGLIQNRARYFAEGQHPYLFEVYGDAFATLPQDAFVLSHRSMFPWPGGEALGRPMLRVLANRILQKEMIPCPRVRKAQLAGSSS